MILSSIRFPRAFGTVCLVCVALFIFPLSPSSQPGAFPPALDLDESDGDQALSSLDVPADGPVTIQIFGSDTKGANSISVRFGYEAAQLVYEGFVTGDVLPGAHVPVMQDSTSVRIDVAALSGSATMNGGLVGTIRFRTTDAFSETEIRLLRAELSRGGRTEVLTPALGVALQLAALPSADFDGSGLVGFADFVLFARAFRASRGRRKVRGEIRPERRWRHWVRRFRDLCEELRRYSQPRAGDRERASHEPVLEMPAAVH